jgi:hypothetical protein
MGVAVDLLIYVGVVTLVVGLISCVLSSTDDDQRKLRAAHEAGRHKRD